MNKVNAFLQDIFLTIAMVALVIAALLFSSGCITLQKSKAWQQLGKSGKALEGQAGAAIEAVDEAAAETISESTDNLIEIIHEPN